MVLEVAKESGNKNIILLIENFLTVKDIINLKQTITPKNNIFDYEGGKELFKDVLVQEMNKDCYKEAGFKDFCTNLIKNNSLASDFISEIIDEALQFNAFLACTLFTLDQIAPKPINLNIKTEDKLKDFMNLKFYQLETVVQKFKEYSLEEIYEAINGNEEKVQRFTQWYKYNSEWIKEHNLKDLFSEVEVFNKIEFTIDDSVTENSVVELVEDGNITSLGDQLGDQGDIN